MSKCGLPTIWWFLGNPCGILRPNQDPCVNFPYQKKLFPIKKSFWRSKEFFQINKFFQSNQADVRKNLSCFFDQTHFWTKGFSFYQNPLMSKKAKALFPDTLYLKTQCKWQLWNLKCKNLRHHIPESWMCEKYMFPVFVRGSCCKKVCSWITLYVII